MAKTKKKERKSWYAVRMLFESLHPEERLREHLFEDRIILFKAATEEEARRKAKKFGKAERHEYKNVYGKKVIWVFREILDVVQLIDQKLEEETEVYYDFLNKTQLGLLRRTLRPFGR